MGEKKRRVPRADWETVRFNSGRCLNCNASMTGMSGPVGERPDKGSLMVCGACCYVMEWDGERHVELSAETMAEAMEDPRVAKFLAIGRAIRDLQRTPKRIIMIEPREAEICEDCGQLEELRPYGHKKPDGKRKWVCFDCAQKDLTEMRRAYNERIAGENPV